MRVETSASCSRIRPPAPTGWTVLAWLVAPGGTYDGKATLNVTPTAPPADPKSVKWTYDTAAPQASVEVPLRVVLVGFAPGEVDTSKLLSEIPNLQRPGVLIPRGAEPDSRRGAVPTRPDRR